MKHIKMALYGEPGVGKSVFANDAPNRFFITTDGNYEFLDEFGAKSEDHVQVHTWLETKNIINDILNGKYDKYDTFVVDLLEDLFKWCEYEYCKKNGYEHVSDVGFAKGYDITRSEFFIEISKLLSLEKNVILLMHGITYTTKDRRGIEHTKHGPSNRLPDKVLDQIEGRVRYFLRCYLKAEEVDGKLIKKRYLSLVPKENEFGIIRGINENNVPSDIPLDFKTFANIIGLEMNASQNVVPQPQPQQDVVVTDINIEGAQKRRRRKVTEEVKEENNTPEVEAPVEEGENPAPTPTPTPQPQPEPVKEQPAPAPQPAPIGTDKNAKLAAIMAKLGKK